MENELQGIDLAIAKLREKLGEVRSETWRLPLSISFCKQDFLTCLTLARLQGEDLTVGAVVQLEGRDVSFGELLEGLRSHPEDPDLSQLLDLYESLGSFELRGEAPLYIQLLHSGQLELAKLVAKIDSVMAQRFVACYERFSDVQKAQVLGLPCLTSGANELLVCLLEAVLIETSHPRTETDVTAESQSIDSSSIESAEEVVLDAGSFALAQRIEPDQDVTVLALYESCVTNREKAILLRAVLLEPALDKQVKVLGEEGAQDFLVDPDNQPRCYIPQRFGYRLFSPVELDKHDGINATNFQQAALHMAVRLQQRINRGKVAPFKGWFGETPLTKADQDCLKIYARRLLRAEQAGGVLSVLQTMDQAIADDAATEGLRMALEAFRKEYPIRLSRARITPAPGAAGDRPRRYGPGAR